MGDKIAGKQAVMEVPVLLQIYGVVMNMVVVFVVVPLITGIVFSTFYNVYHKTKVQQGRFITGRQMCSEFRVLVRSPTLLL